MTTNIPVYQAVLDVSWMNLVLTKHAQYKVHERRLSMTTIQDTFDHPDTTYANYGHDNQVRVAGKDVVLIGEPVGNDFEVVTLYSQGSRWDSTDKAEHVAELASLQDASARRAAAAATVFAACHR